MICIFHSLNYGVNVDLLQGRIYIFWCLDEKPINILNVYTKALKKLLAQDNYENKIIQKVWCLYYKLFFVVVILPDPSSKISAILLTHLLM